MLYTIEITDENKARALNDIRLVIAQAQMGVDTFSTEGILTSILFDLNLTPTEPAR